MANNVVLNTALAQVGEALNLLRTTAITDLWLVVSYFVNKTLEAAFFSLIEAKQEDALQ